MGLEGPNLLHLPIHLRQCRDNLGDLYPWPDLRDKNYPFHLDNHHYSLFRGYHPSHRHLDRFADNNHL